MLPVSPRFLMALRGSYQAVTTVDVYYNQALVVANVPVVDGTITVDRTSQTRRSGTCTIGDPTFFPTFANSALAPYGAELNIKWSMRYMDGTSETVSLGWFRIEDVYQETAPGQSNAGLPIVDFFDRSQAVIDAGFLDPVDRSGWDIVSLGTHLIQDVLPYASVNFATGLGDGTTPGGTTFDSDRWSAVGTVAGYLNAECYFDANGIAQYVPIPSLSRSTPTSAAVWTMDASTPAAIAAGGSQTGVLVQAQRTISRSGVYNAVSCYGSATGSGPAPVGYACDTNPRSPTYYGPSATGNPIGPFGAATYRYTNSLITSIAGAQSAAQAQLQNFLGLARSLSFTTCPNPALEAGDILLVVYPDGKTELHLLDTFTIPLGPSEQFTGTTRSLTYQLSGGT